MLDIFHSPSTQKVVVGLLTGLFSAAVTDLHAALGSWKCWRDVFAYDWGVATFRWAQGALTGALAGAGIGAVTG